MSQLDEIIRREIASSGAIPFSRFMELALYCPDYGYYARESDTVGRQGDFYTSVSCGPLFGQLLAFHFDQLVQHLPSRPLQFVEAGAHNGDLAFDLLSWLRAFRSDTFEQIRYLIVEPLANLRARQQKRLQEFGAKVEWLVELPQPAAVQGVIFSNELLDAMPVSTFGWDKQRGSWFEWGVYLHNDRFEWCHLPVAAGVRLLEWPAELLEVLPDHFTVDFSPNAEKWWRHAAMALQHGWLLTFDYGMEQTELFAPHRIGGTLRAYQSHRHDSDLLARPGTKDLTAHVNFTRIRQVGEECGLLTKRLCSQAAFLGGIAPEFIRESQVAERMSVGLAANLKTLLHPEHLGREFRFLAQSRQDVG